jgi:hypothetical protein
MGKDEVKKTHFYANAGILEQSVGLGTEWEYGCIVVPEFALPPPPPSPQ